MRYLVLGVGAVGGYYGARMAAAGADVTFLVRPKRRDLLKKNGLQVVSPLGDLKIEPNLITAGEKAAPFDIVILTCKAYDLEAAAADIAPYVGPDTLIVPLLNGISHLDYLQVKFGEEKILGGAVHIGGTLRDDGAIIHMNRLNDIRFGRLDGGQSPACDALKAAFSGTTVNAIHTPAVVQAMWDKYVFLASIAAATCLMRASVGVILKTPEGRALIEGLLAETTAIAASEGRKPGMEAVGSCRGMLFDEDSKSTASMMRDVERRAPTESEHIIGHLIGLAKENEVRTPYLALAHSHLVAYEIRRAQDWAGA